MRWCRTWPAPRCAHAWRSCSARSTPSGSHRTHAAPEWKTATANRSASAATVSPRPSARALVPGRPLVVATCGTATTVDAVSAEGRFIGGMILPGLALMAGALARNTAQLPQATPVRRRHRCSPTIRTTPSSRAACRPRTGAIERALAAHGGQDAASCVLSGARPRISLPPSRWSTGWSIISCWWACTRWCGPSPHTEDRFC
nr:type III pantothenate kinase [Massilia sp. Dwa41.01b]